MARGAYPRAGPLVKVGSSEFVPIEAECERISGAERPLRRRPPFFEPAVALVYPARVTKSSRPPGPIPRTLNLGDDREGVSNQVAEAVRRKYRPALIVMSGENVGMRVTLPGNLLVGRDPSAGLVLSDPGVSWRHALVEDGGGTYAIVDLGSTNGTSVNGQKVTRAELAPGDKIRFGSTVVGFEVQDETDEAFTEIIAQLIHVDDLTGLYLRRRFDAELATMVQSARAGQTTVSLLAMDLDGIKAINDRHGHLFGAYTISEAGKLIGRVVKDRGIACRFGGDEFVAALPKHDSSSATEVAEEIRGSIARHAFVHEGVTLAPGISIGVACYPEFPAEADPVELFRRADEALYAAKRAGKNRVVRASPATAAEHGTKRS
jgi:diguanylate cyclase (GGDEF)-like protein